MLEYVVPLHKLLEISYAVILELNLLVLRPTVLSSTTGKFSESISHAVIFELKLLVLRLTAFSSTVKLD